MVIKLFSCSTQLSMKFIMLIYVKMPTIVGILTFSGMINTTPESLKARKILIFQHISSYGQLKFHAQWSWAWKSFITSGPGLKQRTSFMLSFLKSGNIRLGTSYELSVDGDTLKSCSVLTLCMLGNVHAFVAVCWFFSKLNFQKILSGTFSLP